ncbi:Protein kinase [Sulfidibacter corallicola]|uniref:Protein kinase n=1 Tax=Sulfidibacter corallicola TaxID=2818388 RepID=A0A8A4TQV4_SULCO|nr:protein kinase [Sulfidibacter corallicola]QTD51472.1 protein kinase [Sulfidibacter corallicola]
MTKQAKILIAEHEDASRGSLESLLTAVGYETTTASNGQEALDSVASFEPNVAIVDPLLSGVDGFMVSQRITKKYPDIVVIISSSVYRGDRYRRDATTKYGASAFLEKPYSDSLLLETIGGCLRQRGIDPPSPPDSGDDGDLDATVRDTSLAGIARADFSGQGEDDISLDETIRDQSLDQAAAGGHPGLDSELLDDAEHTPDDAANRKEELPVEVNAMLDRQMGEIQISKGKTVPKTATKPASDIFSGSRKKVSPKKEESPAMTVRVSPEELQKEIERIKEKNKQALGDGKKPERPSSSRVKITQSEEAGEGGQLTSNDIFGALIDDIESGHVDQSPVEIAAAGEITASRIDPERLEEMEAEAARARTRPAKGKRKAKKAAPKKVEAKEEAKPVEAPKPPEAPAKPAAEPEPVPASPVAKAEPPVQPLPTGDLEKDSPFATQPISEEDREKALAAKPDASPKDLFSASATSGTNEYQLLKKIASGGMAEVWKAKLIGEKGFEKIVAIKKILPHLSDNDEFISMFIDEARVAANLTHPNIAQIYELGKMEDSFFIAMEYVAGHNLRMVLNQLHALKVTFVPEIVVFIGMKLCNALHYAHHKKGYDNQELQIVHRDVSPQNILISTEGEIKLVDFGIAKASIKATQTVAGSLKGKLLYMSPEQAEGKNLDGRSDIFSLGSVLYEALTGKKLFAGDSELSILKNVRQAKFAAPREINPHIPEKLENIILKALSKDLHSRFDSSKSLENDFKNYLKEEKIHINESDVADYIRLIYEKDVEKLKAFGSGRARAEAAEAKKGQGGVILPDTDQFQAHEAEAVAEASSKGKSPLLWIGIAAVVVIATAAAVMLL